MHLPLYGHVYFYYIKALNGKKYLKFLRYYVCQLENSYIKYSKIAYSIKKLKILNFKKIMKYFYSRHHHFTTFMTMFKIPLKTFAQHFVG